MVSHLPAGRYPKWYGPPSQSSATGLHTLASIVPASPGLADPTSLPLRKHTSLSTRAAALLAAALVAALVWPGAPAHAQRAVLAAEVPSLVETPGPVRLQAPAATPPTVPAPSGTNAEPPPPPPQPYVPGEFERYVQQQAGSSIEVRRIGSELVTALAEGRGLDFSPLVPGDYVLGPGDEVLITLWGSIDADLKLTVDRSGRISVPRVGTIQVSGVRYADLPEVVHQRVASLFRNFQSSVSLGQLRGIRVFVTGFAVKPGSYVVGSLSTAVGALMRAGGPSSAGSFRDIEVRRGSETVARLDLYELLLKGDRSSDRVLQAGDVVHVHAVGTQVGFVGSVNRPAVVELRSGETTLDALRMVGGFSAVADRSRLALERLAERNERRLVQLELPREERAPLSHGDVLRAFSAVEAILSSQRQAKRVRVEGEVLRAGEYVLPENSSMRDAIRAAGGYTAGAYLFGTEFTRTSTQRIQQENYERALRDLETDFARASGSQRLSTAEDANAQAARSASTQRLIERLRALRPSGRIVLQLEPGATDLPDLALEDGDRIYVPPRPTTVGVFGSVFNAASYLHLPDRSLGDYIRLAGGPTKGADERSIYLVRANGNVVSGRQVDTGWLLRTGSIEGLRAEPGDTVFVPEEMDKTTLIQSVKDWTQIVFQFGLGIAGVKSATR